MIKKILKNKRVIFITGDRKEEATYFLKFILKERFSIFSLNEIPKNNNIFALLKHNTIVIKESEKNSTKEISDFLNGLLNCTIVITETEKKAKIKKILQGSLEKLTLIVDFSIAKKLQKRKKKKVLTFGLNKKGADFYISDIYQKEKETNFKINYEGNTIPFWVQKNLNTKEIYSILPALCIAKIFKLNLAAVSREIKEKVGN
jgi:hypothetical protein